MKIYLIRHGETDWNHINRFQGREDIELNAAGIAQAVRCGQTLQGLGIEAVYTSPLKRAHCTGEEIAAQIGYLNPNKFTSAFHAVYGMPPTIYRKKV